MEKNAILELLMLSVGAIVGGMWHSEKRGPHLRYQLQGVLAYPLKRHQEMRPHQGGGCISCRFSLDEIVPVLLQLNATSETDFACYLYVRTCESTASGDNNQ